MIDALSLAFLCIVAPLPQAALPVEPRGRSATTGELELALRPLAVTGLLARERVALQGLPLSSGASVDVVLERVDLERMQFGFRVDDADVAGLDEGLELSVWLGKVAGRPDSEVALSFSQAGVNGWVRDGAHLEHFVSRGDGKVWAFSEEQRLSRGGAAGPSCESIGSARAMGATPSGTSKPVRPGLRPVYTCSIAIETDWQLNQVFGGNLSAEAAYVTSLLAWVSHRFEQQVRTRLTYPYVQFYTSPSDPWNAQDVGGNCLDVLFEFQPAWNGNIPMGADLAHFLSGASLGCGAAYIGGLCDPALNFGVTGNIDGNNQFPIQVGPSNFNFFGVCHELGHNFNAIHTHDYCPPLDQCAPSGYFGPCQTQRVCTSQGTLMSYCHGCPGGFTNITTFFHPRSVLDMRAWVALAGCLR